MYKPDGHNIAKHNIFITFLQHNAYRALYYSIADVIRLRSSRHVHFHSTLSYVANDTLLSRSKIVYKIDLYRKLLTLRQMRDVIMSTLFQQG